LLEPLKCKVDNVVQIRLHTSKSEFDLQKPIDAFQEQLNNTLQTRMDIMEQRIMQAVPSPSSSHCRAQLDALQKQVSNTIQVSNYLPEQRIIRAFISKIPTLSSHFSVSTDFSSRNDLDQKLVA
jgi:hypothetical protein